MEGKDLMIRLQYELIESQRRCLEHCEDIIKQYEDFINKLGVKFEINNNTTS